MCQKRVFGGNCWLSAETGPSDKRESSLAGESALAVNFIPIGLTNRFNHADAIESLYNAQRAQ